MPSLQQPTSTLLMKQPYFLTRVLGQHLHFTRGESSGWFEMLRKEGACFALCSVRTNKQKSKPTRVVLTQLKGGKKRLGILSISETTPFFIGKPRRDSHNSSFPDAILMLRFNRPKRHMVSFIS